MRARPRPPRRSPHQGGSIRLRLGGQFITFHVDGNPKKARGYFKNISGRAMDSFDIFADWPPLGWGGGPAV